MDMSTWLVTGGGGYIGSHVASLFLNEGFKVRIFDNFSAGYPIPEKKNLEVVKGDLSEFNLLSDSLKGVIGVIHLAGFKFPGESVKHPLINYQTNFSGTLFLLQAMRNLGIRNLIFSSSCSVYGLPSSLPVTETTNLDPMSPYARSKFMAEKLIEDEFEARKTTTEPINYSILRYFNVAGRGNGGNQDISPHNLFPRIMKSIKEKSEIIVNGNNFHTLDGTCVRDYIHVSDVARAHLSLASSMELNRRINQTFNLSNEAPTSILQVIKIFENQIGHELKYRYGNFRPGDPAEIFGSSEKFRKEFQWDPVYSIEDMVRSCFNV
jgi:UDP-glucose 4-epimerase